MVVPSKAFNVTFSKLEETPLTVDDMSDNCETYDKLAENTEINGGFTGMPWPSGFWRQ